MPHTVALYSVSIKWQNVISSIGFFLQKGFHISMNLLARGQFSDNTLEKASDPPPLTLNVQVQRIGTHNFRTKDEKINILVNKT